MNHSFLRRLAPLALTLVAFQLAGCDDPGRTGGIARLGSRPASKGGANSSQWTELQAFSFDEREPFLNGLRQLEAGVDDRIAELLARRAQRGPAANTAAWDSARRRMDEARASLQAASQNLVRATRDNWDAEREEVGRAWQRTQAACDQVRSVASI